MSVFVGRAAWLPKTSNAVRTAKTVLNAFRKSSTGASASHNMTAWRVMAPEPIGNRSGDSRQTNSPVRWISAHDDDGENGGGSVLGKVLDEARIPDNVILIVSRWYGGVLLGPVRFVHIKRSAQNAIRLLLLQREGSKTPLSINANQQQNAQMEVNRLKRKLISKDHCIAELRVRLNTKDTPIKDIQEQKKEVEEDEYGEEGPSKKVLKLSQDKDDETKLNSTQNSLKYLPSPDVYQNLTIEKANRLLFARENAIKSLRSQLNLTSQANSQSSLQSTSHNDDIISFKDEDVDADMDDDAIIKIIDKIEEAKNKESEEADIIDVDEQKEFRKPLSDSDKNKN